jgi:hypothetical protein
MAKPAKDDLVRKSSNFIGLPAPAISNDKAGSKCRRLAAAVTSCTPFALGELVRTPGGNHVPMGSIEGVFTITAATETADFCRKKKSNRLPPSAL